MKRRYAYSLEDNYKQVRIEEDFFKGYACFLKLQNIQNPLIVNNGKEEIGLIAQDIKKVFPQVVEGEEGNMSLDYSRLVTVCMCTIKDLNARVKELEEKIEKLENKKKEE